MKELTQAFVLHTRPYLNTSLIIDLLTVCDGRVCVIGKGVRRQKSKTKSLLQPFIPLQVNYLGRSELKTLTQVETEEAPIAIPRDRLFHGFYMNELLMRLLQRHDACPTLFRYYRLALEQLATAGDYQADICLFEKRLLDDLGYGLQYTGKDPDKDYYLTYDSGFLHADPSRRTNTQANARAQQQRTFKGNILQALSNEKLNDPKVLPEAKRLLTLALQPLLGRKPMASQMLARSCAANAARNASQMRKTTHD